MSTAANSRIRPAPPRGPRSARWGLLVVALTTALALVLSSLAGLAGARHGSRAVEQAVGIGLVREIRRELMWSRGEPQPALDQALADLRDEGLRFVGVFGPRRGLIASAGIAGVPLRDLPPPPEETERVIPVDNGETVLLAVPLRPPRPHRGGGPEWLRGADHGKAALVIEFEPLAARAVVRRAGLTFAISSLAALGLLAMTLVFWRASRRAEQAEAALVQDRQLKSLGQMSAVLGHELRNPLASLKGHAQLVVEKLAAEHPARRSAERVVHEATRLEQLSGQVLDFARTGQLDRSDVELRALLDDAVAASGAEPVVVDASGAPARWHLDRVRMQQVLVNLLRNAREACEGGEPVELRVVVVDDRLRVEVRDRGPGIPTEDLEKIFEPFVTSRVHGTGLGLALARRIVEQHGGRIEARNDPQGGARLAVELPAA